MADGAASGATDTLSGMITRGTLDVEADAAYIRIEPVIADGSSVENIIIERDNGTIILDMDKDGRLLGVEVLGASQLLSDKVRSRLARVDGNVTLLVP